VLLSQPQQLISYHMLFCQSSTFFNFLFMYVTGLTGSKNDSIIPVRLCQSYFYIFLQKILQWLLQ